MAGGLPHLDRPLLQGPRIGPGGSRTADRRQPGRVRSAPAGGGIVRRPDPGGFGDRTLGSGQLSAGPGQGTGLHARGTHVAYHHHRPGAPDSGHFRGAGPGEAHSYRGRNDRGRLGRGRAGAAVGSGAPQFQRVAAGGTASQLTVGGGLQALQHGRRQDGFRTRQHRHGRGSFRGLSPGSGGYRTLSFRVRLHGGEKRSGPSSETVGYLSPVGPIDRPAAGRHPNPGHGNGRSRVPTK